eukprot:49467-Eustigmatos_ZCMA.PRE.1
MVEVNPICRQYTRVGVLPVEEKTWSRIYIRTCSTEYMCLRPQTGAHRQAVYVANAYMLSHTASGIIHTD